MNRAGKKTPRRCGVVLIMVLVALGLIAVLGAALVSLVGMERLVLVARERECQARWLAEAGVDRAAARANEAEYAGEVWSLSDEELEGRGPAKVTIHVETLADSPSRRRIAVEAEFPSDTSMRARSTKQIEWEGPLAANRD
ncbi:MAG TPA: hypothetical protein VGX76_05165 [Pirellulales bacterium]|jgi:type II secretory pathway component PulK|nr:hypothetical protein [Pirellulales bacterium]